MKERLKEGGREYSREGRKDFTCDSNLGKTEKS